MREVSGDIPVKRGVLPEGEAGVDETVARMVRMAHGQYGAKSPKVRALAINILNRANVPDKDYYGMIIAVHNWTRDNIRYVLDTVAQETLSHPEETLFNSLAGDCLPGDTCVLSQKGHVRLADICPGDKIEGRFGWTTVLNWWDKGELHTDRLILSNETELRATRDHLFFLADGSERRQEDLRPGDSLLPRTIDQSPITLVEKIPYGIERVYDIETADGGIYLPQNDIIVHNCDDQVISEIALLSSIGIQAWPVVVGRAPGQYSHVYLYAQVPPGKHRYAGKIIPLDPIMREWPAGREAPLPARKQYRQYATGSENTMDGLGFLGAYAEGPSYLPGDLTNSEVQIMAGRDEKHPRSLTTEVRASGHGVREDGTVATSNQVSMRANPDPMDGFFGGVGSEEGAGYHPVTGHSVDTRTRVILADPSGVDHHPVARQQMAARYSRHGQLENQAPLPVSAQKRRLGPDGPMTAAQARSQERLLPSVSARPLTEMTARTVGDAAKVRRNGSPKVTVTDKPAFPQKADGKAQVGHSKCPAQEVEELDGLSNLITLAGQDAVLAGLGAENIGKGWQDKILDDVATMSWWASWKRRLMQSVEQHADAVRKHLEALEARAEASPARAAKARAEASAARELRKAAQAVERQAADLERVTTNGDPAKAERLAQTKAQLTQLEKETGEPGAVDALDAKEAGRKAAELVQEEQGAPESVDGMGALSRRSYRRAARPARVNQKAASAANRQIEKARQQYAMVTAQSGDRDTAEKVVASRGSVAVDTARSKKDTILSRLKGWRRRLIRWLNDENGGDVRAHRAKEQTPTMSSGAQAPASPSPVSGLGAMPSGRNLLIGALLVGGAAYIWNRTR